jgi:Glycosyl transferases group 1
MIRALVFGHWDNATRIAQALNAARGDVRASFVPSRDYLSVLAHRPDASHAVLIRAGYRVGASTSRGRAFDAYWAMLRRAIPGAAACHYWLGTDVLGTVEEARAGTLRRAAVASTREDLHVAIAPWLVSELREVGLEAAYALLPPPVAAPVAVPPLPAEFSVLTYLPMARFGFYGGDTILAAARLLPHVRFDVVGGPGEPPRATTANVRWHGWVNDMEQRYAEASAVVRLPRHDGFGNTVIEALLFGRHCVYNHPVPFVHELSEPTPESLAGVVDAMARASDAGDLAPNISGRTYGQDAFDPTRLQDRLATILTEHALARASGAASRSERV